MPVCRKWINRKLAGNIICLRNLEQKAVFRNSINFIEQLSVSLSCLNTRLGKAYCDYLITAMVNIYFAFIIKLQPHIFFYLFHKQPIYKPTNGYFVVNE